MEGGGGGSSGKGRCLLCHGTVTTASCFGPSGESVGLLGTMAPSASPEALTVGALRRSTECIFDLHLFPCAASCCAYMQAASLGVPCLYRPSLP
jgi:hypothetical protein